MMTTAVRLAILCVGHPPKPGPTLPHQSRSSGGGAAEIAAEAKSVLRSMVKTIKIVRGLG